MVDKTYKKIKRRLWYFVCYYEDGNPKIMERCFNSSKRMRSFVDRLHDKDTILTIEIKTHWCYREYNPRHIIWSYSPRKGKIVKFELY
jgi:hypothetical protein